MPYSDLTADGRATLALEAGGMSTWRWDMTTGITTGDPRWLALWQVRGDGDTIHIEQVFDRIHPDDHERVEREINRAVEDNSDFVVEFRIMRPSRRGEGYVADGPREREWLWLGGRGRITERAEDGTPLTMIGVNWDVTTLKEQEVAMEMLAKEMDHRVKNSFALMRALVKVGSRTAPDLKSFTRQISTQIEAMAEAHSLSARMSDPGLNEVSVEEVLLGALSPWLESDGSRLAFDIDPSLYLARSKVSPLALLTYELATNAAKYGALSDIGGRLAVTLMRGERRGTALLIWSEKLPRGGAGPVVEAGPSNGFGSLLIEHCLKTLRASTERRAGEDGLSLRITLPIVLKSNEHADVAETGNGLALRQAV